jgi:NADPH:quinone reductase-like Zn-dependent oxidoreductase
MFLIPLHVSKGLAWLVSFSVAVIPIIYTVRQLFRRSIRPSIIRPDSERVLILGGSSGLGRSLACKYAQRGARVCIVGRRQKLLDSVLRECAVLCKGAITVGEEVEESRVIAATADFSNVDDMIRVRTLLELGKPSTAC